VEILLKKAIFLPDTGSNYVPYAGLKLTILLCLASECWDYRCVPPYLAQAINFLGHYTEGLFEMLSLVEKNRLPLETHIRNKQQFLYRERQGQKG
jgi:hypothetical protein